VGGAESNVASALVALGHSAAWLGGVGDDPLGRRVLEDLTARGVDVSAVETDRADHYIGIAVAVVAAADHHRALRVGITADGKVKATA